MFRYVGGKCVQSKRPWFVEASIFTEQGKKSRDSVGREVVLSGDKKIEENPDLIILCMTKPDMLSVLLLWTFFEVDSSVSESRF
jgi:hypothetical protein